MPKQAIIDQAFLRAALEGLEIQRKRIDEQIQYVTSMLGKKRAGRAPADLPVTAKPAKKRELSAAARQRIAKAQKKRWAEYRKAKGAGAKASA